MKTMKHILPKLALLGVAAFLAAACNKNTGEGTNVALKRQFDAWRAIHYPAAVEKDGIYIIEDTPGTGAAWDKNLSITFMTYTMRSLDGTVSYNTDEQWAKQLGEWDQTYYYGAQVVPTGKDATYAGLDILLEGMRQGGTRTAIIPSWMMTYDRYDSLSKYLEKSTDTPSMIYTVTFLDQTDNLSEYEFRLMKEYATENWNVTDTLSTAAVFFKSFTHFDEEPDEMPNDTTVHRGGHRQVLQHLQPVQEVRPRPGHLGRDSQGDQTQRQQRGGRFRPWSQGDARRRESLLRLRLQPRLRQLRFGETDSLLRGAPV